VAVPIIAIDEAVATTIFGLVRRVFPLYGETVKNWVPAFAGMTTCPHHDGAAI
jgi:hypothetical protein